MFTVYTGISSMTGFMYYASMVNVPNRSLMSKLTGNKIRHFKSQESFDKFVAQCRKAGAIIIREV